MDDRPIRPSVWASVLGSLAVIAAVLVVLNTRREPPPPAPQAASHDTPASTEKPRTGLQPFPGAAKRAEAPEDPTPYIEGELYGDLDLGEVRAALPGNLYWEHAAPTKDPEVLEQREQEKVRRNEEYGRVLSGDANEEEVNAYYDYREQLSSDYVEFAEYVRRRFGEKLSDQFNGLLDLAIKMNKGRLAQIPADRADALEHSRERAKIREEWQREQAEFDAARRQEAQDAAD